MFFKNMFLGEVFQEVKFWRWLMDIRKLKVMGFRQITLFLLISTDSRTFINLRVVRDVAYYNMIIVTI
jgi:hypothetical protein